MPAKKRDKEIEIEIPPLKREQVDFYILGNTPLVLNRMSEKAKQGLLLPPPPLTGADKRAKLKHDPFAEFRSSITRMGEDAPTLIGFPASGFKKTIGSAAIDLPGGTKAQIGRLVRVVGYTTPIYGLPRVYSTVVRMADMNRTPDIRTRAILPEWACKLTVSFLRPPLTATAVGNLLAGGGEIIGVGDGRQEKGSLDFGLFRLVSEKDPELKRVMKSARKQQIEAMEEAAYFDDETAELLTWYQEEIKRRGI